MKAYLIAFVVDGVKRRQLVKARSVRSAIEQVKESFPDALIVGAGW